MKKLNLFGVFILSIAMLTSGCHRKPSSITAIPSINPPPGQVVPPGAPGPGEGGTTSTPITGPGIREGTGPYTDVLNNGNPNRDIFAADTVYFDFDSATIKASEESKLQDVANHFKGSTGDALVVVGNCDERGTEKYNLSLGERRALAVREYLVNLGMDPQRIKTVTYGASRPVDPGHNEEAWKKNRRGDLVLMTPKG